MDAYLHPGLYMVSGFAKQISAIPANVIKIKPQAGHCGFRRQATHISLTRFASSELGCGQIQELLHFNI